MADVRQVRNANECVFTLLMLFFHKINMSRDRTAEFILKKKTDNAEDFTGKKSS